MSGYLRSTGDHSRSAAAWTTFMGCRVMRTSMGASIEVMTTCDEEPMWRQSTVPSSEHAFQNGSQCSLWRLGQPSFSGFSEKVTAWQPILADPADLLGRQVRVPDGRQGEGDEASRSAAAPRLDVPVVVGPEHGQGHVLVLGAGKELAAELWEGREAHRAEHAVDVHVPHPLVDVPAAFAHVVERGRLDAVLLGRAADHRVEADVGDLVPVVEPDVGAVVLADQLGCEVLVLGGKAPLEEVRAARPRGRPH